jgi:hypothetical protein
LFSPCAAEFQTPAAPWQVGKWFEEEERTSTEQRLCVLSPALFVDKAEPGYFGFYNFPPSRYPRLQQIWRRITAGT